MTRSDWTIPLLLHSLLPYYTIAPPATAALMRRGPEETEANTYTLYTKLLRNLLHDVMHAPKDLTAPPETVPLSTEEPVRMAYLACWTTTTSW